MHSKINKGVPQELLFYALNSFVLPTLRNIPISNVPSMISSTTPHKLAEIIRDTWPQLYRPEKQPYNKDSINIPQNDKKEV